LRGKLTNNFLGQKVSPSEYLWANQLIIKFVRGSAILPWITKKFDLEYDPIYFVRHPFATVSSQLRHGAWDYEYESFNMPNCPYADFYHRHKDFLSTLKTKEEELVALWSLSNKVPLHDENNNDSWLTITYEDMILNPKKNIKRISKRWNVKFPKSAYEKVDKKSHSERGEKVEDRKKLVEKWKNHLSKEKVKKMSRVINHFGIHEYDKNPIPRVKFG
jgi:hypothetical protein